MLPAPPARPFLSLLFPDPAGDLIDLQQLQQQLERAGQLRYARLRLPWVRSDDGSGAPQLAVVQGSSGSWIASLVPEGAGHPVVVQHAVTGRDPQGWRAPQTAPAPPPGSVPLPDGIVAAWQLGNCAFVATVTGEGGNLGTRMYEKQIFPASQGLQGRLSRHWPAQIGESLPPGDCRPAVACCACKLPRAPHRVCLLQPAFSSAQVNGAFHKCPRRMRLQGRSPASLPAPVSLPWTMQLKQPGCSTAAACRQSMRRLEQGSARRRLSGAGQAAERASQWLL